MKIKVFSAILLGFGAALVPLFSQAGTVNIPGFYGPAIAPPPQAVLPVLQPSGTIQGISGFEKPAQNRLVIRQDQPNAVIDWSSFNIGADAWTHFDQQNNSGWTVLNRIYDRNPSLIFGRLTADGKVYLINQNGILFGPGSKVNVNSLVASALNIKNSDLMKGVLNFYVDPGIDYPGLTFDPQAAVTNLGEIRAGRGGSVFLLGPRVENAGVIDAPGGQIGLAAGTLMSLTADPAGERMGLIVDIKDGYGEAWNREGAQLTSNSGWVGIYGRVVNQEGLIRSVTAVKQNGQVELRATERISTGGNSVIQSPITDSPDTADNSFIFSGGKVLMGGLQTVGGDPNGIQSIITKAPPANIELRGIIDAPSGQVIMNAGGHVLLETGSLINVGGAWSDETASASAVTTQLNSVELTDAYGQKSGLLKGRTITANALIGSSIGDISGTILSRQKTALEKSIQGGMIGVTVDAGDVIVKNGAALDFSGGGIRYSGGALETTKLLSGTKIYDIGNAPLSIRYDNIMGQYEKTYERFGVTELFRGIYYGGASPLKTGMGSFTSGGDAGSLQFNAGTVVLNGQLNGSVTQGLFQTNRTLPGAYTSTGDFQKALLLSRASGLEIPERGALTVYSNASDIGVLPDVSDPGPDGRTVISAKTINAAGLGSLYLNSNSNITTDANARIILSPGGTFGAQAGRIEHYGDISAPAGAISLSTVNNAHNIAPANFPDDSRRPEIYLGPKSRLSVAGERTDNSLAGKLDGSSVSPGQVQGGTITIQDQANLGRGVFIPAGAVLDVSGGYRVDPKGKITGGNAGTLDIGGTTLMFGGDIMGYALADGKGKIKGGQIILRARDILVDDAPSAWPAAFNAGSSVPGYLENKLVIAGNRFSDTGFTRIELYSFNNITINDEVVPSMVKLKTPAPGVLRGANIPLTAFSAAGEPVLGREDLIRLDSRMSYESGPSAFVSAAGKLLPWQDASLISPNNNAALTVSPGAAVRTAPEGKISLSAPGAVTMAGTLESLAGQVNITAGTDLAVSGRILAGGYNRPDSISVAPFFGYTYRPVAGGQVALQASNGNLRLEQGTLIDVSGSNVVNNTVIAAAKVAAYNQAGDPGGLSMTYSGKLTWDKDATVNAQAKMAGIKGGTLTISRTDANGGLIVSDQDSNDTNFNPEYVNITRYKAAGFDALTLRSLNSIRFSGSAGSPPFMDVAIGRKLTLDAPEISVAGNDVITLRAPWITLANTYLPAGSTAAGEGRLILLSSGWIDLDGQINLSGFNEARLEAVRDIRLMDRLYTVSSPNIWQGQLSTASDLILKADRIYPTTFSKYTLQSSGGKVTILPADNPAGGQVFSAGGDLIVEAAKGIEVKGTLAAPMGSISLSGTGPGSRVYLAEGSLVTTAGNSTVNYGTIYDTRTWVAQDKVTGLNTPMTIPGKSVTIGAPEIIIRNGAVIDSSGGGSIFAYRFQPGVEGSVDPFAKPRRYVILSDRSVQLPGDAVYLTGGAGLSAGVYSLLPAQYAFLPGAVVIEEQSFNVSAGESLTAKDGYPVVAGYSTVFGTSILNSRPKAYAVMAASDVLSQGNFTVKSQVAGDAGNVVIKGKTSIIDGVIRAAALDNYQGGKISLSAADIWVQQTVSPLPAGFDFGTGLDSSPDLQGLRNRLSVAAPSLSGKGFQEIGLGDPAVTDNVTVRGGAVLESPVITLSANKTVTVESGAQLQATAKSGNGVINIDSPAGTAVIPAGALLHASHAVNLNAGNQDIQGDLKVDNSALTLKGTEIFFVPDGYKRTGPGLYITDGLWSKYRTFEEIRLVSASDLLFTDNFELSAVGSISIDAARIAGLKAGGTAVSLTAPAIYLFNSGAASSAPVLPNAGRIDFSGDNITVGGGDVLFGGFAAIHLDSRNDLTLKGAGSLKTGGGDLNLTAGRVTTTFDRNQKAPYIASNFHVDAGSGAIRLDNSLGAPGRSSIPGGVLDVSARKIDLSGTVDMGSGTLHITASGGRDDGIFLRDGGRILARGNDSAPGGRVTLRADNGSLVLEPGSLVDISAGAQGDAGAVTLLAPAGGVTLEGNLSGTAQGAGISGSFAIDTDRMLDFSALNARLAAGGFTESADIRVRSGNAVVPSGTTVQMRHFKVAADSGEINVYGSIDAPADAGGGIVELYAAKNLTLGAKGYIDLSGRSGDSNGGEVILSSSNGFVSIERGAGINASGSGRGLGGVIHLRALRDGDYNVKMDLRGTVTGASNLTAEAVRVYDNVPAISWSAMNDWDADNQAYLANGQIIKASLLANLRRLGGLSVQRVHLLPGIEVRNAGDITIGTDRDLTAWRYNSEPGVLTIRAGGNLTIDANLTDHPTSINNLPGSAGASWALNLAAGADIAGADHLAVLRGQGNLVINDQKLVYTESAPIRFASGNDTLVGTGMKPGYMTNNTISYNLASYSGPIRGNVGRDLGINGGAIETATGNIDINVGRDLILRSGKVSNVDTLGSIRTTGHPISGQTQYWNYGGGGNITLAVGGNVGTRVAEGRYVMALSSRAWDQPYMTRQPYKWAASYTQTALYSPTAGLAAIGGGDVVVRAGGDFLAQAGTFGQVDRGDLIIHAGGDINGRFLNRLGRAEIHAMGNFGAAGAEPVIEAFDSRINVSALGNIDLGAVVNPTIAHDRFAGQFWNLTYTKEASVSLKAGGDVTIIGRSPFYNQTGVNQTILPATVEVYAGGDIRLKNSFALAPSPQGNLRLIAGNDIDGAYGDSNSAMNRESIFISDMNPSDAYASFKVTSGNYGDNLFNHGTLHGNMYDTVSQTNIPLHGKDITPVEIKAGRNVGNLKLFLPKKAEITAGQDIRDIYYFGQNVNADDVSRISAGRDIFFSYIPSGETGVLQTGPGALILQAGNSIDLGSSNGIQSKGNEYNPALDSTGSSLMVLSGYARDMSLKEAGTFFEKLRAEIKSGDSYTQSAQKARADILSALGSPSGGGDINMTVSQISTNYGKSDIFIIANGALNVGKSTFFSDESSVQKTGILTSSGGAINIFANGDVNVNESRIMSFFGGDITVWSDYGDINAGRGSKTAINASAHTRVWDKILAKWVVKFVPPAVGSGIRAVTYSSGGVTPPPGDIYPHAKVIDAGEAGLSGGNIFLQAQQVVNASNITSSLGSIVGMPQAAAGTTSIGTLSGTGSVATGTAQVLQGAAEVSSANSARASQMTDDIMAKWLDVKVIDFVQEE